MRETEGWKSFAKTSGVTLCSLKLLYFITLSGERERKEGGREGRKHLRRKKAEHAGKRGVCSQSDFVGERFLPRFLTQGRRWIAAGCGTDWARAEAALYAWQGSAAPDQHKEPKEGQVQLKACGYRAGSQAFNYSHVGYEAAFFMFRWLS